MTLILIVFDLSERKIFIFLFFQKLLIISITLKINVTMYMDSYIVVK